MTSAAPTGRQTRRHVTSAAPTGRQTGRHVTSAAPTGRQTGRHVTSAAPTGRQTGRHVTSAAPTGRQTGRHVTSAAPTGRQTGRHVTSAAPTGRQIRRHVTSAAPTGRQTRRHVTSAAPTGRQTRRHVTSAAPTGRQTGRHVTSAAPTGRQTGRHVGAGRAPPFQSSPQTGHVCDVRVVAVAFVCSGRGRAFPGRTRCKPPPPSRRKQQPVRSVGTVRTSAGKRGGGYRCTVATKPCTALQWALPYNRCTSSLTRAARVPHCVGPNMRMLLSQCLRFKLESAQGVGWASRTCPTKGCSGLTWNHFLPMPPPPPALLLDPPPPTRTLQTPGKSGNGPTRFV